MTNKLNSGRGCTMFDSRNIEANQNKISRSQLKKAATESDQKIRQSLLASGAIIQDDPYQNGYFNGHSKPNPYPENSIDYSRYEDGKQSAENDLNHSESYS